MGSLYGLLSLSHTNDVIDLNLVDGWSLLGSNQRARPDRLLALGWKPEQSLLSTIHEEFPAMVEAALEDYVVKAKFAFR